MGSVLICVKLLSLSLSQCNPKHPALHIHVQGDITVINMCKPKLHFPSYVVQPDKLCFFRTNCYIFGVYTLGALSYHRVSDCCTASHVQTECVTHIHVNTIMCISVQPPTHRQTIVSRIISWVTTTSGGLLSAIWVPGTTKTPLCFVDLYIWTWQQSDTLTCW